MEGDGESRADASAEPTPFPQVDGYVTIAGTEDAPLLVLDMPIYWVLEGSGLWARVNAACGAIIDMHEEDVLTASQLPAAYAVVRDHALYADWPGDYCIQFWVRYPDERGVTQATVTGRDIVQTLDTIAAILERGINENRAVSIGL